MKNIFALFLLVLLLLPAFSQNNRPHYELTADDIILWPELRERSRNSTPPTAPVIGISEFTRSQGVLVAYPSGLGWGVPNSLLTQLSQMGTLYVAVSSTNQLNSARNSLQNNGANMNNVQFVQGAVNSYWTRDFGPWFIIDGNDEFGVADFTYNRPSRPDDDAHMAIMATYLNVNHFDMPLVHTGGNYMTDGYGTAASTNLVYEENSDLSEDSIRTLCANYLGINQYHFTIDPQGDYIAHIDCWGKFLDVDKVLIAQLPVGASQYQQYEDVAAYYANATSAWGNKYQVFRVFEPGSSVSTAVTPYTNSLILNDHVFVPVTGTSFDEDAIECYRQAMPGYTIVPVMERSSAPWENTDALHCRTHEIPDLGMLYIRHFPTLGEQSYSADFPIVADITAYSHQEIVSDSVLIHYRIIHDSDTTAWTQSQMSLVAGKTWSGAISGIVDTCEVQYYLQANDQSGRREFHPLIGAADPHAFTVMRNPSPDSGDTTSPGDTSRLADFAALSFSIAPNPVTTQFTLTTNEASNLVAYNCYGQTVLSQQLNIGPNLINCSHWPAGAYLLVTRNDKGNCCRQKIIIQ